MHIYTYKQINMYYILYMLVNSYAHTTLHNAS